MINIPAFIILDLRAVIKPMRQRAVFLQEREFFMDDLLQDTIESLSDAAVVPLELNRLVHQIHTGQFFTYDSDVDPEWARYVLELGIAAHQQLLMLGAYTPEGKLPYSFYPDTQGDGNDLLLRRLDSARHGWQHSPNRIPDDARASHRGSATSIPDLSELYRDYGVFRAR